MFDVLTDFEWFRDRKGYRIVPFSFFGKPQWQLKGKDVDWIVPRGDQEDLTKYFPFVGGGDPLCCICLGEDSRRIA